MIISASIVRRPYKSWGCASCAKPRDRAPHVVVFGYAERGDAPYQTRVCLSCASSCDADTTVFLVAMKYIGAERLAGRSVPA